MDYEVIWSPEALEDAEEIARHIHKDSPHYAGIVTEKIIEASRTLNQSPRRGRVVPELGLDDYREIFIYSYRLIYLSCLETLRINRCSHSRTPFIDECYFGSHAC